MYKKLYDTKYGYTIILNPKRAGLFGPISQPEGGGADSAPLRSQKPIDEISSLWY